MGDFLEGLSYLLKSIKVFDSASDWSEDLESAVDYQVKNMPKPDFGSFELTFKLDEEGKSELKCGTKDVDREKLQKAITKNDIDGVFKELLDEKSEVFKSDEYKTYLENTEKQIKESAPFKDKQVEDKVENKINDFEKKFGKISTTKDFQSKYNENTNFKKFVDDICKKSDDDYHEKVGKGGDVPDRGSWTKTKATLLLVLGSLAVAGLLKILQDHANAMSGCFKKDTSINGKATKCKVKSLTCNTADISACTGECTMCSDPVKGCIGDDAQDRDCFNTKGATDGTCLKYAVDETKKKTCITYIPTTCAASDVCNTCTCDVQSCPKNTELECKKANIGDAFIDYFNDFIGDFVTIFKKILVYAAIILLIGIVIYVIVKFLGWLINRRKSKQVLSIS